MSNKDTGDFEYHLRELFRISKEKYDIDNPLDKSKWREIIVAERLGHNLFKGASGGKNNDATYGADAVTKAGQKKEYKTRGLTSKQYGQWRNGECSYTPTMIYNGAYSEENINRYRDTDHILCLFYNEKNLCNVEIPIDHVTTSLFEVLYKKQERRKNGKEVTTNCNAVSVKFINNVPQIGKVL